MDSAKPGSGQRKSQRQKKIQSPFVATDDQTKEKQASKKSSKEKPQKSPRKENHDIGSADKQATPHKIFDESDSEEEGDIDISAGNTETTRGYKPPSPSHTPSRGSKRAAHAKIATEGQAAQKKQKAVKKFAAAMQDPRTKSKLSKARVTARRANGVKVSPGGGADPSNLGIQEISDPLLEEEVELKQLCKCARQEKDKAAEEKKWEEEKELEERKLEQETKLISRMIMLDDKMAKSGPEERAGDEQGMSKAGRRRCALEKTATWFDKYQERSGENWMVEFNNAKEYVKKLLHRMGMDIKNVIKNSTVGYQDDLDRLLETKQLGFKKMDESERQKLKKAAAEYYNKHRRLNQCSVAERIKAARS